MNIIPNLGSTGLLLNFLPLLETREIIVIEGIQYHDADILYENNIFDEIVAELDSDPLYWKNPRPEHKKQIKYLKKNWRRTL